jgi:hypothetical protein
MKMYFILLRIGLQTDYPEYTLKGKVLCAAKRFSAHLAEHCQWNEWVTGSEASVKTSYEMLLKISQ